MRSGAVCWVLLGVGALAAQQPPIPMPVREIKVRLISTTRQGLPAIDFGAIAEQGNRSCSGAQP